MTAPAQPRSLRRPLASARPTRLSLAVHNLKVMAFRARRVALDLVDGPPKLSADTPDAAARIVAESRTPLWAEAAPDEQAMQRGKVANLRRACRALDGLAIPAGATFSFWRQVGRPTATRGFTEGRALKLGCMVPSVGGGLCQLSNALFDVALQAGCDIVERHAHSRLVPGSTAAPGRDATVAWNYVDLRFRPTVDLYVAARVEEAELVVLLKGCADATPTAWTPSPADTAPLGAASCASCQESDCFMHERNPAAPPSTEEAPRRTPFC